MKNHSIPPVSSLDNTPGPVRSPNGFNPAFQFNESGIGAKELMTEVEELTRKCSDGNISTNLQMVLETQEKLRARKAGEIRFSEPLLMHGDNAVVFPRTINVIQGQAGVHKSRLAEIICAAFLRRNGAQNELLGFKRNKSDETYTVVYVDTERNLTEQLPYALQSIQLKAGFNIDDDPAHFEFISLLQIDRKDRFATLNEYLNYLRRKVNNPLFIVLDVSTDCIEDFNKTDKSMELIDLMNVAINDHDVTFLCLIHENPKSDKARGHFGTELMNKASTVMQVGFEKDANQNDTDIVRVKYLKCRSTVKHPPFHIKYDEAKGLVMADASEVSAVAIKRQQKANMEDVLDSIEEHLGDGATVSRTELLNSLCSDLSVSRRTIEKRIVELLGTNEIDLFNRKGDRCKLLKETKGKEVYYSLILVELS